MPVEKGSKTQPDKTKKKSGSAKPRRNYKKEVETIEKEFETLKDQYIRAMADFDNYRKRTERDFQSRVERSNIFLLEALLPVIDDFERSLNSKAKKNDDSYYEGVKLVYAKFKNTLEKVGLETIEAVGKPFDPELHEAILQVSDKGKASNVVVDEATKGYRFRDTVIRHSKVVVNK
jgi:molecular chaperone GrpE